jgi:nitrogenase molybdenum-iron protein alpha/beta subunit
MGKLSHEEFIQTAIVKLRTEGYKGIHSVYSGFNEAFKAYFSEDPVAATTKMSKEGKIQLMPVKGGVMIYLPGEAPVKLNRGEEALRKMGL